MAIDKEGKTFVADSLHAKEIVVESDGYMTGQGKIKDASPEDVEGDAAEEEDSPKMMDVEGARPTRMTAPR